MPLAPRRSSHRPSGSSPLNSGPQERHQGPADYSQWADLQYDFLAPPLEAFPTTVPVCQSFDTLTQSALWTEPDLSFETDWNFLSANSSTPYPAAFDDVPVMDVGYGTSVLNSVSNSLSESGSIEHHNSISASLAASSANSGMLMLRLVVNLGPDLTFRKMATRSLPLCRNSLPLSRLLCQVPLLLRTMF